MVTETPSPPKAFTKSDQWLLLVKEMRGNQTENKIWNQIWDIRGRAGRPGRLKSDHTPWPGNFSIHHILLRRCSPGFDFINPDSHLYVSKVTLTLRSQKKILKERFSFRSFLINRHLTSIIR